MTDIDVGYLRRLNFNVVSNRGPCIDCRSNVPGSMLSTELWEALTDLDERKKVLCDACIERRLGRPIVEDDLIGPCPWNKLRGWYGKTEEVCSKKEG